jgi:DNA invertase Pin-like site-specific DNA recombinase
MDTTPRNAAIYARISSDPEGTALGVQRQMKDCRALAKRLGWTVAEEYVDNDISAYSGKHRPGYERMLEDIADGMRDGLIVYHLDRLTRRPIELKQFVTITETRPGFELRTVAGGGNLGTGDGLMVARIMSSVAANESAAKSRRIRRKQLDLAERGLPSGGGIRPFAYEQDRMTVIRSEAKVLRTVIERYLAGESLRSLATWLNDKGISTVAGGTWTSTTLRGVARNPRYAGLRAHRGQVIGKAVWPAIIDEDTHRRVLAAFDARTRGNHRTPQRYLLTGLLRCGKCGNTLFSSPRANTRRYVCLSGPDHGGCGHLTVVAAPLEAFIAEAVIYRLDTPQLAAALTGTASADSATAEAAEQLSQDKAQLEELATAWATKTIGTREWQTARKIIEERIRDNERRLARATRSDALAGWVGHGSELRTQWANLNLSRQHAIVKAILDFATINAGTQGARSLDIERVVPTWRYL